MVSDPFFVTLQRILHAENSCPTRLLVHQEILVSVVTPNQKRDVYTVRNCDRQSTLATRVTIAGTSRERRAGLKNIPELPQDAGLWIAPCEAIHTFGMKVCIDAVFLDRDFRVRKIQHGLTPRRIAVCMRAYSVLELPAGTVAHSATYAGDRLEFTKNEARQ